MSLPEFKFNMRLKQGSPFGVTPNSYVNIYEVDSVEIINSGSDVPDTASISVENISTQNVAPREGNSENAGYPNEYTEYKPLIGESTTTLQQYRGLVSLVSGVSFTANKNATFNLTINSGQVVNVAVINRGLYYGIGTKTETFSLPYRAWPGNSTGNLDAALSADGGYFEGAPIEVVMNAHYESEGYGNETIFNDTEIKNLVGLGGTGRLQVFRKTKPPQVGRQHPKKMEIRQVAVFPYDLATKTIRADAAPSSGAGKDFIEKVRYFDTNARIYGSAPPELSLTNSSIESMSSSPIPIPHDGSNQGLRLEELPVMPIENFDKNENFVIVQKADGSMRKMKFANAIPVQSSNGINFLKKSVRIVEQKLTAATEQYTMETLLRMGLNNVGSNGGTLLQGVAQAISDNDVEQVNVSAHLKDGQIGLPESATFVLVTIGVGYSNDASQGFAGGNCPYFDGIIGNNFRFSLSRGSGRQTPISKQILAPLTSSGRFTMLLAGRGSGNIIVDLHGYG